MKDFPAVKQPSKLRILVTNDDGINAPGLECLIAVARKLSRDVWVVAPEMNQSGAGHSLSLSWPLRTREAGERKWAVEGTPTDCVLLAVRHLLKDKPPTLVLSGVNRGTNMASDVTYSGTIAAAMEGCLLGVQSIALSQAYTPDHPIKWATALAHAPRAIRKALSISWPDGVFMNINFPDVVARSVKGLEVTGQAQRDFGGHIVERTDPRGGHYYWIGYAPSRGSVPAGTDVAAIRAGKASITPLHLDLTHEATRARLKRAFA